MSWASVLRLALLEVRALHRATRLWLPLGLVGWACFLRIQEPSALARAGISLFWTGVGAALTLAMLGLPLLWVLVRGRATGEWLLRHAARPVGATCAAWLGLLLYGAGLALVTNLIAFSVDSIWGSGGGTATPRLLLEAVLVLAPAAALAPGLAHLGLPPTLAALVWLLVLGASLLGDVPVPAGSFASAEKPDGEMVFLQPHAILAALATTTAGLFVSLALATYRTRS